MFTNMGGNDLTMLSSAVCQDVLDEIITELVSSNVDKWHTGTIGTALTDALKITVEKFVASDLEALFDNLGSILVHAVLGCKAEDMINSTATISWSTMFANVLDAPVSELAVRNDVDASENFIDARTLPEFY